MDWSQSLNAIPFFDGGNYAFGKVRVRAFLCAIDESVWDSIVNEYVKPTTAKSERDKVALALANVNSKTINAIFCGVSPDEFHKRSHVKTAKEAWMILETTYEAVAESGFDSRGGKIYIHYACILKHTHITYMLGSCKGIFFFFKVKIPLINENIFSNLV